MARDDETDPVRTDVLIEGSFPPFSNHLPMKADKAALRCFALKLDFRRLCFDFLFHKAKIFR